MLRSRSRSAAAVGDDGCRRQGLLPCLRSQVVSLIEKLQEKEAAEGGDGAAVNATELLADAKASLAADADEQPAADAALEAQQVKSEDRLSTGSSGSAVVDADALLRAGGCLAAAVDSSVESYFPGSDDQFHDCAMSPLDHGAREFQSGEDDGACNDEGCSYYADDPAAAAALFASQAHHHVDDDNGQISWWMWN
ncbi:homeobox-leucine zipper protein HOX16-like [Phragmites australis]|uniref:homeobox-leucine zipper protein HOX16-like n=1 Tax=Phragmites australis TaxID=29695 RepID=UPI002D77B9A9|nr:homeobox-leucine zipper protein HOX16-like [Phragmites australis]